MLNLTCLCGASFSREEYKIRPGRTYCCSAECRKKLTSTGEGTKRCSECAEWKPSDMFRWIKDERYAAGGHLSSHCEECKTFRNRSYHANSGNKERAKVRHAEWRAKRLAEKGGLHLYLSLRMGAYRKTTRDKNLPACDIDADYLVDLFHAQKGACYYTGTPLVWQTNGQGAGDLSPTNISLDRKDPLKGYTRGNVAFCGFWINTMKGNRTEDEFLETCRTIIAHRG